MNPLDVSFEQLSFRLPCNGRTYTVTVGHICSQPLDEGLLEHSYMDPEEWADWLQDMREEELGRIEELRQHLTAMWGREEWTVLTPPPHHADAAFQSPERLFGRLCAAIFRSWDDFFPTPYRDEMGESSADFSEACVIYAVGRSEGLLPERIRREISWEDVARPGIV